MQSKQFRYEVVAISKFIFQILRGYSLLPNGLFLFYMHINQISYTKTFNLGNYSSEKIGVEITLNEGEDAKESLATAKALVEEYHKQSIAEYPMPFEQEIEVPVISKETKELLKEEVYAHSPTLEEQIMSCEEITVLKSYVHIAKRDPQLQLAYDKKMYILKLENKNI